MNSKRTRNKPYKHKKNMTRKKYNKRGQKGISTHSHCIRKTRNIKKRRIPSKKRLRHTVKKGAGLKDILQSAVNKLKPQTEEEQIRRAINEILRYEAINRGSNFKLMDITEHPEYKKRYFQKALATLEEQKANERWRIAEEFREAVLLEDAKKEGKDLLEKTHNRNQLREQLKPVHSELDETFRKRRDDAADADNVSEVAVVGVNLSAQRDDLLDSDGEQRASSTRLSDESWESVSPSASPSVAPPVPDSSSPASQPVQSPSIPNDPTDEAALRLQQLTAIELPHIIKVLFTNYDDQDELIGDWEKTGLDVDMYNKIQMLISSYEGLDSLGPWPFINKNIAFFKYMNGNNNYPVIKEMWKELQPRVIALLNQQEGKEAQAAARALGINFLDAGLKIFTGQLKPYRHKPVWEEVIDWHKNLGEYVDNWYKPNNPNERNTWATHEANEQVNPPPAVGGKKRRASRRRTRKRIKKRKICNN